MTEGITGLDQEALARGAELFRPLKRAAWLGRLDGACYCIGGVLSLLFAIPGEVDWVGVGLGVVLLGMGLYERDGARRLVRSGEPEALTRMARAELVLLAVLVSYFLYALLAVPAVSDELRAHAGELEQVGIDVEGMSKQLSMILYPTLIAATVVFQGGMARTFLKRRADAERYVAETPEWARTVVQSMAD